MKKQFFSIILMFLFILSNISFALTNVFCFISENNNNSISNAINIQDQYNMFIGIPKDFLNICIKIKDDFSLLKIRENKVLYFNKNINFYNDFGIESILNSYKLKFYFIFTRTFKENISLFKLNNLLSAFLLFFIFYLIKYIGLLKLFSALTITKQYKNFLILSNLFRQNFYFLK